MMIAVIRRFDPVTETEIRAARARKVVGRLVCFIDAPLNLAQASNDGQKKTDLLSLNQTDGNVTAASEYQKLRLFLA
jgi:hypothetical protein